jgi:hypothetical protein
VGDPPFHAVGQLEAYADNTAGTLLQLTLQACGVPARVADHAATHIGRGACRVVGVGERSTRRPDTSRPPPPPSQRRALPRMCERSRTTWPGGS